MPKTNAEIMASINSSELEIAIEAARLAGSRLLAHFGKNEPSTKKLRDGHSQGLVTTADLESEKAIVNLIREWKPTEKFLAEENFAETSDVDHRIWVIDPLDGTNNFAHGIPHFAISIALWEAGSPKIGVIHDPIHDDWFIAAAGQGACHNGRRSRVNDQRALDDTIIATGFYYDRGEMMEATLVSISDLFRENVQGIRRFGAASLDLAWVGLGRFGGFFEYLLAPWDFAAGMLFVIESGGIVTNCQGQRLTLRKSSVLASNSGLHADALRVVSKNWNL